MWKIALRNLVRRPVRASLTLAGIAAATAVLVCVVAFGDGYREALRGVIDRSGVQMMLVPLGCPYDSASRVLQNNVLEHSLPAAALDEARRDPSVAVAAPLLTALVQHKDGARGDIWVGLEENALALKPWWQARSGARWFAGTNEVILGADVASLEMREPGDRLYSVELGREFRVAGVLARSGTADDNAIFVPLPVAQGMLGQEGRLTAVALRLHDPAQVREAARRLQTIRGAQVVTMTEMMGTFLNLLGTVRTLVMAVAAIAVVAAALTVFNTLLAAVVERMPEFAVLRAMGASRGQVFVLLLGEAAWLTAAGAAAGLVLAWLGGPWVERAVAGWLPILPAGSFLVFSWSGVATCVGVALAVGLLSSVYPAWRAALLPPGFGNRRT